MQRTETRVIEVCQPLSTYKTIFTRDMALGRLCVTLHEPSGNVLPLSVVRALKRSRIGVVD